MNLTEKIFHLKENKTNIKTEILAGFTTFFTMSYLLVLSPKLLEAAGMNQGSSLTVTAIIVFICSFLMAFIANKPYAVAPLLGETAFIAYTICSNLGFSVQTALTGIFICGLLLLLMTLTNIREYIIKQIPENIKISYCIGLGLFFIFIALKDIGIVNFTQKSIPLEAGAIFSFPVIMGILCFLTIIILEQKRVKGSILIAIMATTAIGIIAGDINLPSSILSLPVSPASSLLQFDFNGILHKNFIPIFFVIFMLVNIDTAGALITLSYTSSQENGKMGKKPMIADSLAVILAALAGTTTPGAYIDSMTGIKAGGKTGLTAITVGVLFLLALLFTPVLMIIPSYAYAPALLYVGILITTIINKIDFNDITEYAPALLTVAIMIFTYNIGLGIISAFVTYPIIKALTGKYSEINVISKILFVVSLIFFAIYPY